MGQGPLPTPAPSGPPVVCREVSTQGPWRNSKPPIQSHVRVEAPPRLSPPPPLLVPTPACAATGTPFLVSLVLHCDLFLQGSSSCPHLQEATPPRTPATSWALRRSVRSRLFLLRTTVTALASHSFLTHACAILLAPRSLSKEPTNARDSHTRLCQWACRVG